MSKRKAIGAVMVITILATVAYAYISMEQDQVEETETAKIAAFNIQIFGQAKSQKEDVMSVLTKIVREFDIASTTRNKSTTRNHSAYPSRQPEQMSSRLFSTFCHRNILIQTTGMSRSIGTELQPFADLASLSVMQRVL